MTAKDTSLRGLLGISTIAGIAQQGAGGLLDFATLPGYLVGGVVGAGKDVADAFLPALGAQMVKLKADRAAEAKKYGGR